MTIEKPRPHNRIYRFFFPATFGFFTSATGCASIGAGTPAGSTRRTRFPSSRYVFKIVFPGTTAPVAGSGTTSGDSAASAR